MLLAVLFATVLVLGCNIVMPDGDGGTDGDTDGDGTLQKVETPIISPATGEFTEEQTVTITSTTSGAAIYYTVDNTVPSTGSILYNGSFTVSTTTTVQAIAVKTDMTDSDVASSAITITIPQSPVIGPTTKNGYPVLDGVSEQLNDIHFVSSTTGFIAGNGLMLNTTDGGTTWEECDISAANDQYDQTPNINAVDFVDTSTGYAAGRDATIIKTTDGGTTWVKQTVDGYWSTLYGMSFLDADYGWAVGANGSLKTTDGGTTWEVKAGIGYDVWFVDQSNGFSGIKASGYLSTGFMKKTTDGGDTWTSYIDYGNNEGINSFSFADATTGYASGIDGYQGLVLKTTDGGANWTEVSPKLYDSSFTAAINELVCVDSNTVVVCCGGGDLFYTTDGGTTWIALDSGTSKNLNSVFAVSDGTTLSIWVIGDIVGLIEGLPYGEEYPTYVKLEVTL